MAAVMANRASSIGYTARFIKFPCNFISSFRFSTSPASTTVASSNESEPTTATKPKNTKKKNLFEVAQFLPNWGIGYHMAKTHWKNVTYEITKINLYKDGKHGKAWGIAYKDGLVTAAPKKISGVHKRCWKYIPNSKKTEKSIPTAEPTPTPAVAAPPEAQTV